jgi:hypothetical protein
MTTPSVPLSIEYAPTTQQAGTFRDLEVIYGIWLRDVKNSGANAAVYSAASRARFCGC